MNPEGITSAAMPASPRLPELTKGLSLLSLREALPERYGALVRWATLATIVGYSLSTLQWISTLGVAALVGRPEIYTWALAFVALFLERTKHTLAASSLVLSCVLVDICVSFAISDAGLATASMIQVPVMVLGAGLFWGVRGAYVVGAGLPLLVMAAVQVGAFYFDGPGVSREDTMYVIALVIGSMLAALMLHVFLRSFGEVLNRSLWNEGRLADLVRSVPDGVLLVDPEGKIESHNEQAARLFGIPGSELAAASFRELPLKRRNSDQEGGSGLNIGDLSLNGVPEEFETSLSGRVVELRVQPVAGEEGQESRLVLLRDVSERIASQEREQELAARLLHSQKLEAVGRLAGGVAHDFNNLLTVVAGYADIIDRFEEKRAHDIAGELRATYRRGEQLTRQLLAFARRDVVNPRPIDLAEVVRGSENLLRRLSGEQVRVVIEAEQPCPIVADPSQVEQALMNLATNARDAMKVGGTLSVSCCREGERILLEVTDTGVGMDAATQERAFEPFFTTKERGKGTGLGLAMVHGIVTNTGGEISLDSSLGEGATFRLFWPSTKLSPVDVQILEPSIRPIGGCGLILLAEDDPQTRKFIGSALKDFGYDVIIAQDGAEALSLAVNLKRAPDLIVTDVMMPGMTGAELVERLRKQHPKQEVLFVSGYTDDVLEPQHLGSAEDLLQKPFGRDALLDRVHQKLSKNHEEPRTVPG